MPTRSTHGRAYLLLTLAPLFWSGNVVLARAMRGAIPPASLTFWRWLIALAILLPLTGPEIWRHRRQAIADWKILGGLGFLGVFLYQALSYQALTATTALNALLIAATAPLLTALINWIMFREAISPRAVAGIALSLAGVGVVLCRGDWATLRGLQFNPGDLLMLASVGVWALYSVLLQHRRPAGWSALGLVSLTVLAGMAFVTPAFFWRTAHGEHVALVLPNILTLAYIGVFASVLGYVCWNEGVAIGGANLAGLFVNLMPVFGAALAVLFLGEVLAPYHFVGATCVGGGIALGRSP